MEEVTNNEKSEKKIILKGKKKKRSSLYKSQGSDMNTNSTKHLPMQDETGVIKLEDAFEMTKGNQCSQWAYGLTLGMW